MRVLVAIVLALASVSARADDPDPAPMDAVGDVAEACAALHDGAAPDLPCTQVGRVALAGGATATLYSVDGVGFVRWTIVIDDHGALSRSPWLELDRQDCAMHQCTLGEGRAPRLRTIHRGTAVAIALSAVYTHERTDPNTGRTTSGADWRTYDVVVCGPDRAGGLACVTRHRGAQGDSCTGALAADGTVTTTCKRVERVSLD